MINIQEVKEKILSFLSTVGPSLPIPVAKSAGLQTMLASAVLSELINEKKVVISNMRVGNSPLYFIPGQEARLEPFSDNLHGVEKDAFNRLKENQVLVDGELDPALRVALRHLKDFAFSFHFDGKLFWRYFLIKEDDAKDIFKKSLVLAEKIISDVGQRVVQRQESIPIADIRDVSQSVWKDIEKEKYKEDIREKVNRIAEEIAEKQKELEKTRSEILAKITLEPEVGRKILEKPTIEKIEKKGKKADPKQEFLGIVKDFILKQNFELVSVEGITVKEILARVRSNSEPDKIFLLIVMDKKKLAETDFVRAYKKAAKLKLPYYLVAKGENSKKIKEKIEAFKGMVGSGILGQ